MTRSEVLQTKGARFVIGRGLRNALRENSMYLGTALVLSCAWIGCAGGGCGATPANVVQDESSAYEPAAPRRRKITVPEPSHVPPPVKLPKASMDLQSPPSYTRSLAKPKDAPQPPNPDLKPPIAVNPSRRSKP